MRVLIVAPHPDDETLGCGGTILRSIEEGEQVHWLIITASMESEGFNQKDINKRNEEINKVRDIYRFKSVTELVYPTTKLDSVPLNEMIQKIGNIIQKIEPDIIYLPYPGDIHTDHNITFKAVASCIKWFRYPSIKKVLAYETLSETEFAIDPGYSAFKPNVFVDISDYIDKKMEIIKTYKSEFSEFPFPRSEEAIRALATLRGATSGCKAAEAFMLLKEIV